MGGTAAVVTFGLEYEVRAGCEAAFERAAAEVLASLATQDGHRRSRLYRDVFRPASYLVYSEWASRQALARFAGSEAFRAVTALGAELLLAPPRHRAYTPLGEGPDGEARGRGDAPPHVTAP